MYAVAYSAPYHIPILVATLFAGHAIDTIWNSPEHNIHYVLRQIWILKRGPKDTNRRPQSTMYGFVVPSLYIRMLAVYITFMLLCAYGIFWHEFLLERTIKHSSEVDCFFIENFWDFFKFIEPVDCNDVTSRVSSNPIFECFKYKFDFIGASLTAGPVLAFSAAIMKVLPICFLFLKRCDTQRYRILQYCIAFLCLLIITLVLLMSAGQNLWKFTTFLKLCSISLGILLSLTVPFLDFRLIPTSIYQKLIA